jgi:hypothetical protein
LINNIVAARHGCRPYIVAAVLDVLGLAVTLVDLHAAQRRLNAYFSRPINVYVTDAAGVADALDASVVFVD